MPGGRPVGSSNKRTSRGRELFAPHVDEAIEILRDIVTRSKKQCEHGKMRRDCVSCFAVFATKDADAIAAAKIILEYGLGKPVQVVEGPGDDGEHKAILKVEFVA